MQIWKLIIICNITLAVLNAVFPADPVAPEMLAILEQHIQAQEHIGTVEELPKYPWNIDFLDNTTILPENTIIPETIIMPNTNIVSDNINITNLNLTETPEKNLIEPNEKLVEEIEAQKNQERLERRQRLADLRNYNTDHSSAAVKESRVNVKYFDQWLKSTLTTQDIKAITEKDGHINMNQVMLTDLKDFCKEIGYNAGETKELINKLENTGRIEITDNNRQ